MKFSGIFSAVSSIGHLDSDDESTRMSKQFLVLMSFTLSFGATLGSIFCFVFHIVHVAYIPLGYTLLTIINFCYFYFSKDFTTVKFVQVFASLLLPFYFQISLGGIVETGGIMLWSFLSIVSSMAFLNTKQSILVMCSYLVIAITLGCFDSRFEKSSSHLPEITHGIFLYLNLILTSCFIYILFVYFVRSRNTAHDKLVLMNKKLEETVYERTSEIISTNDKLAESNDELSTVIAELEEKNQRIVDSLNYAQLIQSAILNNNETALMNKSNHFILLKPRDIVSGDFYWSHVVKSDQKIISVTVDCTGHGVPGAMMSLVGDSLLNQIIVERNIYDPREILEQMDLGVNRLLKQESSHVMDGMDMAVVVLDYKNEVLEFAGANSPLVIIADDEMQSLKGGFFPIGGISKTAKQFEKKTIPLKRSSIVYHFSDGYGDQFGGEHDKKFMATKFRDLLFKIHKLPMETQKQILIDEHLKWKGERAQTDDILVVAIKVADILNVDMWEI